MAIVYLSTASVAPRAGAKYGLYMRTEIYFDAPSTLAKKLSLRGIPTSILLNKEGKEFARIVGSINFEDKKFIKWLSNYN